MPVTPWIKKTRLSTKQLQALLEGAQERPEVFKQSLQSQEVSPVPGREEAGRASEVVVQVNEAAGDGRQPESSKCASSALSLLCRNQIRKPSETEKLGKAHSVSLLAKSEEEPLEDHPVQ